MWVSKATILATILVLGSGCAAQAHRADEGALLPALPHTEAPQQIKTPQHQSNKLTDALKLGLHLVRSQIVEPFNRPVSYVSRLALLVGGTANDASRKVALRTVRLPALEGQEPAPLHNGAGMDLEAWEEQLDELVGNHRSFGKVELLIDGDEYFPALESAIAGANESIKLRTYIFDTDDVSLAIADQLKARSTEIDVDVMFDGLGT